MGRGSAATDSSATDETDVSASWDADNQAWWDWYVGLAENADTGGEARSLARAVLLRPDPATTSQITASELAEELGTPYPLSDAVIEQFRVRSYVKLKNVLSPRAVSALRREIVSVLEATFQVALDNDAGLADGDGPSAGRRFYSAEMAWLNNPILRLFVLSPRIAKICADLLGVEAVRLYHDNLLSKEPGCGRTPWHYDDHHFPLATNEVVTAWIAAQAIPTQMGPLAFAHGIETWRRVADVPFSKADTSYDRLVAEIFARDGVLVDDGPFDVGEVSFHHNLNFHTAGRNLTPFSRCALANTFYADGARVVEAPTMVSGDWRKFLPGVEPGGRAASPLNPICWPAVEERGHPPVNKDPEPTDDR
ncbi:MAG: phytanoyl-CoA dioxygenase family protein [Pseudomonadota bacterium]